MQLESIQQSGCMLKFAVSGDIFAKLESSLQKSWEEKKPNSYKGLNLSKSMRLQTEKTTNRKTSI